MATNFLEIFAQPTIETRFDREDGKNRNMGQAKIGLLSCAARRILLLAGGALRRKRRTQKSCLTLCFGFRIIAPLFLGRLLHATCPGCLAEDEEFRYAIFIVIFESNHFPPLAKPRSWRTRSHFSIAKNRLPSASNYAESYIMDIIGRYLPAFRGGFFRFPRLARFEWNRKSYALHASR